MSWAGPGGPACSLGARAPGGPGRVSTPSPPGPVRPCAPLPPPCLRSCLRRTSAHEKCRLAAHTSWPWLAVQEVATAAARAAADCGQETAPNICQICFDLPRTHGAVPCSHRLFYVGCAGCRTYRHDQRLSTVPSGDPYGHSNVSLTVTNVICTFIYSGSIN